MKLDSDETAEFTVRFWGVRGSIASPGPETARYGGNTPCLEVRCGDHLLIFDAGTGIRLLGAELERERARTGRAVEADLFLTHTHYDHISGLPFFAPAYGKDNRILLWEGHLGPDRPLEEIVRQLMSEPLFPVPLNFIRSSCRFRKFAAGETLRPRPGVVVRTAPLKHPNNATAYRVDFDGRSLCYVTDTEDPPEGLDPTVLDLVRGADMMIHDATYTDAEYPAHRGWGHSTWQQAVRIARAAEVKRCVLFHHDPSRTDADLDRIAAEAAIMHPDASVAAEGETWNV